MFTIATTENECCGMGDFRNMLKIDGGENGNFPPLFRTMEGATKHLSGLRFNDMYVVVELTVAD